jgi:phosphopantothenoylcysteine decarboxylase / phosphopantothenate---cysteine ligase
MLQGKRIVLGISGGIAAYKAAWIVSQLSQRGVDVRVIMTAAATRLITPLTMQVLSHHRVMIDTFDEQDPAVISHIDLADHADLVIVAPATANVIAKCSLGLGDDMLSTTLLATQAPIVMAPAMNVHMYENPLVQKNIHSLRERGVYFIDPEEGPLACGYVGQGRMAEPDQIVTWVEAFFAPKPLAGKKVLVTAGPTVEPLDPVRFFSNYSSGKMGFALASAAKEVGCDVLLVTGPVALTTPVGVQRIDVKRAEEMKEAVFRHLPEMDIIIKAAAVADYRPKIVPEHKIKKIEDEFTVVLEKTEDIAREVGKRKKPHQFFVGFAAETEKAAHYAITKLAQKGMDFIVANDITLPGAGFDVDTNEVTIYDQKGEVCVLPQMHKVEVARRIIAMIGERLYAKSAK